MKLASASAVIGLTISVLGMATPAAAACILNDYSVEAEFDRSNIVMVGRVDAEKTVTDHDAVTGGTYYRVRPNRVFKGSPRNPMWVYSENSSGRFPMEIGKTYLLFAYRGTFSNGKSSFAVDNCGRSQILGPAATKALDTAIKLSHRRAL